MSFNYKFDFMVRHCKDCKHFWSNGDGSSEGQCSEVLCTAPFLTLVAVDKYRKECHAFEEKENKRS